MSVSNRCAPGAGRPNGTSFAPGTLEGTDVRAANPDPRAVPNQFIVDALDRASSVLPAGYFPQITPEGGRADREGTQNHPAGDAADIQIISPSGTVLRPADAPELYEKFIGGLTGDSLIDNRVAGIGMYDWGIHFDQSGWRQTGSGGVATWNGWGSNPNPGPASILQNGIALGRSRAASNTYSSNAIKPDGSSGTTADPAAFVGLGGEAAAAEAQAAQELAKQNQSACTGPAGGPGSSGGCSPVSALAIGAVASMAKGEGLGIPSGLTDAVNQIKNNPIIAKATAIAQTVAGVTAQAEALINNPLGQIAPAVADAVLGAGSASTLNALTGKFPAPIAGFLGGPNLVSGAISDITSKVFGSGDLARFSNIFNSAIGAVGVAQGLGQSLNQIQSQIFGNSKNVIGKLGDVFQTLEGMSLDNLAGGQTTSLIGKQSDVLQNLLGKDVKKFAAFGSVYNDFNSMVTQGLGSVTKNIGGLGQDLQTLGNLANLKDLLRIGTPGQIVEQLAVSGSSAVSDKMAGRIASQGVSIAQINSPDNDQFASQLLGEVTEPELIQDAFDRLNINRPVDNVGSLADLTDPNFLFPNSKDDNSFSGLNDISLHLAVCGAQGFDNLTQFGTLLSSMESVATDDSVTDMLSPVSFGEISELKASMAPTSEYTGDNDLTVADFLGTAAGYRHTETLPVMTQLLDELNSDPITQNYRDLNDLLDDTLNGVYTVGPSIVVPNTAGYTFGTYSTLGNAATAIVAAIETELDVINNTATGDTALKLSRLQSYHDEVSHQIYKEEKLRRQYGINLAQSTEGIEFFGGDGSTVVFQLTGSIDLSRSVTVFLDGVKQSSSKISFNKTNKRITFVTAPGSGVEIEVNYETDQPPITGNVSDIWNFASSLENFGTKTGFGREADFIGRIVSNDQAGTRIKSTMIQARNRQRAADAGMECPGYNRTLSSFYDENVNGVTDYASLTGVWSADPARAAEIYLQNSTDVESRQEYIAERIKSLSFAHQPVFDKIMAKTNAHLIFYSEGNIAVSDIAADLYAEYQDSYKTMQFAQANQLFKIDFDAAYPSIGYAIGPYKQIISEILRIEGIQNDTFTTPLSQQTKEYLQAIEVDLTKLVGVLQKTMLVNAESYLGIDATDIRNIFGMPGVGKYLLANMSSKF